MPWVWEDVAYGARNRGFEEEEVKTRVDEALEVMGIGHLRDRVPFSPGGR
ncbi:MAG: hypothetical protein J7K08_06020 [Thermoplasmata archaeon]|nr:hypothetical protein [Thermoplasmata archaeon]